MRVERCTAEPPPGADFLMRLKKTHLFALIFTVDPGLSSMDRNPD